MPLSEKARHTIHYLRIRGSCFFPPWVIWLHISISFYFTFHYMSQLIPFHPHVLFRFIQIFISEIPQSQYWNISSLLSSCVRGGCYGFWSIWLLVRWIKTESVLFSNSQLITIIQKLMSHCFVMPAAQCLLCDLPAPVIYHYMVFIL